MKTQGHVTCVPVLKSNSLEKLSGVRRSISPRRSPNWNNRRKIMKLRKRATSVRNGFRKLSGLMTSNRSSRTSAGTDRTGIFLGIDRLRSCAYVRSSRLSSRVKSGLSAPMTVARKPNTNRFWTAHRLSSLPCAWCPIRADESTRSRSKIFAVIKALSRSTLGFIASASRYKRPMERACFSRVATA
jgi:hypothetical protein